MRRDHVLAACAAALALAVAGFGAYAWEDTERRVLGAAEAEGRAMLASVAAGIEVSLDADAALQRLLSDRLAELSRDLDARLGASRDTPDAVLAAFIREHGLRGCVWLDQDLRVVASADRRHAAAEGDGRAIEERAARIEAESVARRAAEAGLASRDRVVLGFGASPFGVTSEYLVATRAASAGGHLVLRQDAADVEGLRAQAGVARLLREAARADAIAYVAVVADDGSVLAADDPARVGTSLPPTTSEPMWRRASDGRRVLDVALPAPWKGPPAGSLRVGLAAAPVEDVIDRARRDLVLLVTLLIVTGTGGLVILAVRERRAAARESALQTEIDARDRFAALGRLAGAVAHEVRSPLNALSMATQRLRREGAPKDGPERAKFDELQAAQTAAIARIDRTVEEFVGLARADGPLQRAEFDVADLARSVLDAEDVPQDAARGERLLVAADRALLERAVANLVRNARQCAGPETVSVAWRRDADDLVIEVADRGPGIAPEDRERIFDAFHTRRAGGMGLGLTIARDAARRHGGDLTAAESDAGARFVLRIPIGGAS